jgi:hypothetical protein
MRTIVSTFVIGCAVLWGSAAMVRAGAACKQNARDTYVACKSQCRSDFLDAKFTCRNVQPACGEACLAGRQQCFDTVDLILSTGVVTGHCSTTTTQACHVSDDCPTNETCSADSTLDQCANGTDACQTAFITTATTSCGATCSQGEHPVCGCAGNTACAECIDQAQITRFICRDTCRDSFRVNSTVQTLKASCRSTFKACVQACPPAN